MSNTNFIFSPHTEPHRIRTKQILKQHPEVRNLIGKNPNTIWIIVFCVSFQVGMAFLLRDQAWYILLAAAYIIGAFPIHTLYVTIHEVSHNLLFKSKNLNTLAGILANLPSIIPSSVSFQRYHLRHHSFQGVYELDGDLPFPWEAKLVKNSPIAKVIWLLLFPVIQVLRTFRLREIKPVDGWIVLNFATQIIFSAAIIAFMGWGSLSYLFLSFYFSLSLHPLGARWIQEHYVVKEGQETYSYYGFLNLINFDIGHHNEHHDFPSVPWNNLAKLKKTAPEFYDTLYSYKSWTKLLFRFIFDKKMSLYDRVVRNERGKLKVMDKAMPDMELINAEVK